MLEQLKPWLILLPLVLALVKFGGWVWKHMKDQFEVWLNKLIEKKLEAHRGTIEDADFALREELQRLVLKVTHIEEEMAKRESRLVQLETKMDLFWGSVERNAASLLRDRSREE